MQLRRVIAATDEAFISIDAAGSVTVWSGRAERLFGWTTPEVLGRRLADLIIPPAHRGTYEARLARFDAADEAPVAGKRLQLTARHRDGHEIPVEVAVWALDDGEGFSAFVHDITERVSTQAALEAARDAALEGSRLKSEFLANMSHEVRTPMNGIIGMSRLMLLNHLEEDQRNRAGTVLSSAEALLTVLNDILDFSKIEAGKLDVERIAFDLRRVVEETAVLLAAQAQATGLELTCLIDPNLPRSLEGDPGRLRQVLLNLLGNAVKFTPAGAVTLSARLVDASTDGTAVVELAVSDTGIGMTAESVENLFEAFTQADTSTTRRYGGTGLGLAISRQLVTLMGGTIDVVSEPDVGTTFTALIPFCVGPAGSVSAPGTTLTGHRARFVDINIGVTPPYASPDDSMIHPAALLVVEDNPINQMVIVSSLSRLGYDVDAAANGAVALEHLDRNRYAAVFMDCQMPVMDGYEATSELRRREGRDRHTPVIAITASAMAGDRQLCLDAGMDDYLTKPLVLDELMSVLRRWSPGIPA
jgi:PAS domain S-box-containing protein